MSELLCPAGSFDIGKAALLSGADALYLATSNYGARAYAKNLTLEELDNLLNIAHAMDKKIYITVNTIIKENELSDCLDYVKKLYELGVDGIICTDLAVVSFIKNNCPNMECHISTQSGVKDLNDVLFFENYGVDRVVLARENSIDEIKKIKAKSKMPLEVFIHGALCVSYSGGCLMSSLLSLRSGNRGRCAQNCRREYKLKENGKIITDSLCLLSMKDLNTSSTVNELVKIGVDSLKIEGRMKNEAYVSLVTKAYRNKIDDFKYNPKELNKIFHREYTKGFLNNESNGNLVNSERINNVGEYIGKVISVNPLKIKLNQELKIGDRIRFNAKESIYLTIDKLIDLKNKTYQINQNLNVSINQEIYRMKNVDLINYEIGNSYKLGLDIFLYLEENNYIEATVYFNDQVFQIKSNYKLEKASNKPLTYDVIEKQLKKLNDTPFYLNSLNIEFKDDVFTTISNLNELRRNIINEIYKSKRIKRTFNNSLNETYTTSFRNEKSLICFCNTKEQFEACKKLNILAFYDNYSSYVNSSYPDANNILVGNYGGLYHYKNKDITTDYSFNVSNSLALNELFKLGVNNVTYSLELSKEEIKELALSYKNKFNELPNCDLIIYGRQNLMTLKYCPLKHLNLCPKCKENKYELVDEQATFPLIHKNCITHVLNNAPLNLIDELHLYYNYVNRFRINFTLETKEECEKIIKNALEKLNNIDKSTNFFEKNQTRGYFKRPIL